MAFWVIIHQSDEITVSGDDYESLALAVMLLGEGYGAKEIGGSRKVPMFFFGEHDKWMRDTFGRNVSDSFDAVDRSLIASVLKSAVVGGEISRVGYEKVASKLDGLELEQWHNEYHDRERSSMNDICHRAWALGEALSNTDLGDKDYSYWTTLDHSELHQRLH